MKPVATFAILGTLLVAGGCVAVIPYNPKDTLVQEVGAEAASEQLLDLLLKATEPKVVDAKIDAKLFMYEYQQVVVGAFYQTSNVSSKNTIRLVDLTKVEVYENGVVYIYHPNISKFAFPSPEDGKQLADILMSFKAESGKK